MWYVRDVLYAVLYVRVSCFVVRGCGVSRRYIDVCYCDMFSHLSFIPHITSLKSRCTKSLDLIKVLSNTTWGADRKVLLRLYRALIRSKLDYGFIVYSSARPSYIKRLDTVHNQGLRLCLGAFRTSPVHSLYVEANEPPLGMRSTRLCLQYCVKLISHEVNPAYSAAFQSDIVATY